MSDGVCCARVLATSIPRCYRAALVHGFVEELVVNEDPEYQWIDRIRTPRASNEARQRLISLMSGRRALTARPQTRPPITRGLGFLLELFVVRVGADGSQ